MNRELEQRALDLFEESLDWREPERSARLARLSAEPELRSAVLALIDSDARAMRILPTQVPGPQKTASPTAPPARIGPYRLGAQLGAGGMGIVYRGERDDGLFEHSVAIKLMRTGMFTEAAAERFAAERRILARLRHPNIAQLFDGGIEEGGRPYIIMEPVEGVPIDEYVRAHGAGASLIVDLMSQVCAAVHCAHQNLIVHADIKPSNVLVQSDGSVKLLDFGIARLLDSAEVVVYGPTKPPAAVSATAAAARSEPLTRAYASPERCTGEPARPPSDIYSLGVVLHQLCAGVVPPGPPLANRDFGAIVACATATDPAARYGSALELAADLKRHLRSVPVRARPRHWRYVTGRFITRHRWGFAATVVLAVVLLATSIISTRMYLRAEAARTEASRRYDETHQVARYMLFDLYDQLRHMPGTASLRLRLAEQGERYLARLAAVPNAPASVSRDVAIAYRKLGAALGVPGEGTVGRKDEALAALRASETLLAGMQRAAPLDDAIAVELARTRLIAARVHYFADTTLDQSAGLNASGLALLDGVLERQPANGIARFWRWTARVYQAQELLFERKAREAVSLLDMLAVEAPTMQDDPEFPDYRLRVEADLHTIRGDALWELDEHSVQPLVAYQRAVGILEQGKKGKGEELALDVALANALWSVAYAHAQLGQGAAALAASERAGALLDHVLGFGPDDWAQYVRANVRTQRAVALQGLGRHREAAREFEQAYASMLARAQRDPDVPNTIRTLAILTEPMGHNYMAMGQKNQGCAWLRRSLGYWTEIRQRWGVTPLDEDWINGYGREFGQLCRDWGSTPES